MTGIFWLLTIILKEKERSIGINLACGGIKWNEEANDFNHRIFVYEKDEFEIIGNRFENSEFLK